MDLEEISDRANWLSTIAQRAQYVCRSSDGNFYVTDDPPFLTDVVRVARPKTNDYHTTPQ